MSLVEYKKNKSIDEHVIRNIDIKYGQEKE